MDLSVTFFDPVYLQMVGGVREENALEYFARSPFFARGEGVEFLLESVLPHPTGAVFVVKRQRRRDVAVEAEAFFYILHGTIYQCPSLYEVCTSRVNKMSFYLKKAYRELEAKQQAKQEACSKREEEEEDDDDANPFPELGPKLLDDLFRPAMIPPEQIRVQYDIDPSFGEPDPGLEEA